MSKSGLQLIVISLLLAWACRAPQVEDSAPNDAAVLRVVLAHFCSSNEAGYFVLNASSVSPALYDPPAGIWSSRGQAAANMLRRNEFPRRIPQQIACDKLQLQPSNAIEAALARKLPPTNPPNPGWEGFYDTFKNARGVVSVSLPGYSYSGGTACVYLAVTAGGLAGAGGYAYLEKQNGKWVLTSRERAWIA